MAQDPAPDRVFHALTAGSGRDRINCLNQEFVDRRIHQALVIVGHLKTNDGKILGDLLYEELKRPMF